jgi:hypothetical protein
MIHDRYGMKAVDEDVEKEVVEVESKVEKVLQNSRFLCHREVPHCKNLSLK